MVIQDMAALPKYRQVALRLQKDIAHELKNGCRIPTEPDLEKKYNVSRITIRQAVSELIDLGKSILKPFITDITIIKVATPSIIPINEKLEIIFKKLSLLLGFKYRLTIKSSALLINFISFF